MTEPAAPVDAANLPRPTDGPVVSMFLTVRNVAKSRQFYTEVLGGSVVLAERAWRQCRRLRAGIRDVHFSDSHGR